MAKKRKAIPAATRRQIAAAVDLYKEKQTDFEELARRASEDFGRDAVLRKLIHSVKYRAKDPEHLRDKLERKWHEGSRSEVALGVKIFSRVDDLAGIRLIHLNTQQFVAIHERINEICDFRKYRQPKKPIAYTWDIENRAIFNHAGVRAVLRETLYTSVHYVVEATHQPYRCEIQVRTLAEEIWGEVSHTVNYPHPTSSVACREQLLALARVASGCTRLVDSIFASKVEHEDTLTKTARTRTRKG